MSEEKAISSKILKIFLLILLLLLLLVIGYVLYLQFSYYRIPDAQNLEPDNRRVKADPEPFQTGIDYSILTYNIGFGAYEQDYSFFMDTAVVKDSGEKIAGAYGKGISKQNVAQNTAKSIEILHQNPSDIYLLQEVDTDSSRSFQINQQSLINAAFPDYASQFAENFHSAFLPYPLHDMHGYVNSGLLTLSQREIAASERYSYPITDSFFGKFFDLDRCFSVSRFPLAKTPGSDFSDNDLAPRQTEDKELVIVNSHMSAYDKGGEIRKQQLSKLRDFMEAEYKKGNYLIVGGDYNHEYAGTIDLFPGNKALPSWLSRISNQDLPQHFSFVIPENATQTGSCRGAEEPFNEQTSYQCTVDGFIISDNIEASAKILDFDYQASDHNPVHLSFRLK